MSAERIPRPTPLSTYEEATRAALDFAVFRIEAANPMLCGCGERKQFASQTECERCFIAGINARYRRRRERAVMLAQQCEREGWTACCAACYEKMPEETESGKCERCEGGQS